MLHVSDDIQYCFPNVARLPQPVLPEEKNWLCIQKCKNNNPSFADDITLAASDATDCQQSINTIQKIVNWTKTMASNQVNADHGLEDFLEMVKKHIFIL